jgi:hypothetical protein
MLSGGFHPSVFCKEEDLRIGREEVFGIFGDIY